MYTPWPWPAPFCCPSPPARPKIPGRRPPPLPRCPLRRLLESFLRPLLAGGADTLVLGCTHYPFLSELVQELAGPGVAVVEPGAAVSRQLERRLVEHQLLHGAGSAGTERFWTSGDPAQLATILPCLWHRPASVELLPA